MNGKGKGREYMLWGKMEVCSTIKYIIQMLITKGLKWSSHIRLEMYYIAHIQYNPQI
jgi:hypothetical protein